LLNKGLSVRFEARGASMFPCIRDRQIVHVAAVIVSKLRKGDIVLAKGNSGFRVHRLVLADHNKNLFITRGDSGQQNDLPVRGDQILGLVVAKEVKLGKKSVPTELKGVGGKLLQAAARGQYLGGKLLRRSGLLLGALGLILVLAAPASRAQVAVDTSPSTNTTADLAGHADTDFHSHHISHGKSGAARWRFDEHHKQPHDHRHRRHLQRRSPHVRRCA
jgi:hypothetical protein